MGSDDMVLSYNLQGTFLHALCVDYVYLVSVRLWNFKDGGSKKVSFLAKNQHTTKENVLKNSY